MARTFYRYKVEVEILSEEPFEFTSIHQIANVAASDGCSGEFTVVESEGIDGLKMAELCWKQGTDPRFFGLDKDGNDVGYEKTDIWNEEGE